MKEMKLEHVEDLIAASKECKDISLEELKIVKEGNAMRLHVKPIGNEWIMVKAIPIPDDPPEYTFEQIDPKQ